MSKRGGKGRISNDLVAASCAAVLAVYGAGYWRTREAAQRLESRAHQRRPVTPEAAPTPAALPAPAPTLAAPEPAPAPAPPAAEVPSKLAQAPTPARKKAPKVEPVPAPAPAAPPEPAAAPVVVAVPETPVAPTQKWRDGTYTGWGQSYHGDIEAKVVIRDGRIVLADIATCATRYPCYVIEKIIDLPVKRQSSEVDRVSGATESADAYSDGVAEALKKALDADAT